MGRLIDRHAIDEHGKIGAVVEVVASHQKLVSLPLPAVQGDDETGHRLQQLPRTVLGVNCSSSSATTPSLAVVLSPIRSSRAAVTVTSVIEPEATSSVWAPTNPGHESAKATTAPHGAVQRPAVTAQGMHAV